MQRKSPLVSNGRRPLGILFAVALLAFWHEQAPASDSWNGLAAAARQEGKLNILAGGSATRQLRPLADHFGKKFSIEVRLSTGSSTANVDRVLAERRAGRHTEDIAFMGARSGERMIKIDALEAVEPLLVHPEVTNRTLWYGGRYWWGDLPQKFQFTFASEVSDPPVNIAYNTKLVDPGSITSMWNLLEPHWKIVAAPPTHASGQTSYFQLWIHPQIGREWVQRFLLAKNVTFSTDPRGSVDGLAQGKYTLAVQGANVAAEIQKLEQEKIKLPVAELKKELKEPGFLTGTGSMRNIAVLNRGPHPNAAKLFLNWFLSREGQTAYHTLVIGTPSMTLREDEISPGNTEPTQRRKKGRTYEFASNDPEMVAKIRPTVDQIIEIYKQRQ